MSDNIKDLMMELEIATISAHDESRPIPAGAMDKLEAARDALRAAIAEKDAEIADLKASLANLYHSYSVAVADVKKKETELTQLRVWQDEAMNGCDRVSRTGG